MTGSFLFERNDTMVNSIFKTYEVTVDTMRDSIVSQAMRYSQNDLNSAKILIHVNHNGKEEDFSEATVVRVSFEKADKKIIYQDCQPINALKGKYQVLLTTQSLTSIGIVTANVHIYFPNGKKIETGSFAFEVVESKMSDEVMKSTNEFPLLKKAMDAGEQLKNVDIQALIASKIAAEAANEKADGNTVQIEDLQKNLSKQDVKPQLLQHGPNVVNATVASPLNIEVQGRTLINLLGDKGTIKDSNGDGIADLFATSFNIKGKTSIKNIQGKDWQVIPAVADDGFTSRALQVNVDLPANKKYIITSLCMSSIDDGKAQLFLGLKSGKGHSKSLVIPKKDTPTFFYMKFAPEEEITRAIVYNSDPIGEVSEVLYTDLSIYEVSDEVYNKIDVHPEYSKGKLADKFPHVDHMQHLNPVIAIDGVNLFPPVTEFSLPQSSIVIGPYEFDYNPTIVPINTDWTLNVIKDQIYTISAVIPEGLTIQVRKTTGASYVNLTSAVQVRQFTPIEDKVVLRFYNSKTGTLVVKDLMLVLGDIPKSFSTRNRSYLYTNENLAGMSGINDVLYKDDDQWKVLRKWERDVLLDPTNFPTCVYSNYSGYKRFGINPQPLINAEYANLNDGRFCVVKYDGKILQNNNGYTSADQTSLQQSSGGGLKVTVANEDSGFNETYTPSTDEVSAYFNGWKVKNADGTGKPTAWVSLVEGQGAPTQTLAYVKANRAAGYTPYKLTYQLATPRVESVQVEGDLVVDELSQVTVDSGVVVREKINPKLVGNEAYINVFQPEHAEQRFKNRCNTIIKVYRNGMLDTSWMIGRYGEERATGWEYARIKASSFDPKAEYTVTYLVLDKHKFTTNTTDVKVSYAQSIRSTVDELTVKQSDTITGLSILQNLMTDVLARLKANSL